MTTMILPWLILAAATATTVAAWNNDEFYNTSPFAEAAPGWVKASDAELDAGGR
jgi:hypothetical protein